jgi:hypothetical protein
VNPGSPGGHTTMTATYYAVTGTLKPVDSFILTRPRSDS